MTYSIWLLPTTRDAKHLGGMISKLAIQHGAPKFSAHITLYSGIQSLAQAKSAVNMTKSRPIRVQNLGIGQSEYLWKTMFLRIKKEKQLNRIYLNLQKNLDANYKFQPHISIIYKKLDHATKRKIKSSLKIKKSYTFDKIIIIRSSKHVHKWEKLYSLRLDATMRA